MSVKLNSSGGGSVTLQEPTTASNFTLTLPAQTATVITDSSAILNIGSGQIYKDASGNVGIGTSSPGAKLDVNGTIRGNGNISTADGSVFGWGSFSSYVGGSSTTNVVNILTNSVERMRIDSSGNLLVGATSAAYGERLYAFVNSAQNCIGARLGASANSCTAFLATADASASGYDFIGCYSGPTPTIRFRVNSSGDLQFNSGFGSAGTAYGCRAWVNFNGQGTVSIRASGNVSSITDNGVGNYTINLSTAMPDTNYNWVGAVRSENDNNFQFTVNSKLSSTKTTSALQVRTGAFDNVIDVPEVNVSIFR